MSRTIKLLLSILCLLVYGSLGFASDLSYKPGELLVHFAPKADDKQQTLTERDRTLASIGVGTVKYSYKLVPGLSVVKLPVDVAVESALAALKNADGILYAEPNYKVEALSTFPNDPNFSGCVYTWGTNWWGDEDYEWGWITEGYGLLGTGSNVDSNDTPVKVLCGEQHPDDPNQPYLNHIVAVTAGWDHCLALEKDDPYDPNIYNPTYTGRVYAWGNNGPGWGGVDFVKDFA
jgi:hypothetical protein